MELNFLSRINAQQVRRFGKGNSGRNKRISICTVPLSFSLSLSLSSIKELQTMAYFRTRERRGRIGNSKERPVLALPHRLIDSRRLPASTSTFSENAITSLSLSLSFFEEEEEEEEAILSVQSVKICSRALGQDVYIVII